MNEHPNLKYVEELAAGSEEFKQKLLGIIKREFPEEKKEFVKNFTSKNYKIAAENVHKLKHKIGMMGFEEGYQIAIDFEEELIEGEDSLFSKFMLILESIDTFLKTV